MLHTAHNDKVAASMLIRVSPNF